MEPRKGPSFLLQIGFLGVRSVSLRRVQVPFRFRALCAFAFCAFWFDCHCYAWFLGHPDRGGARRLCCHHRRLECALAWYSSSIEWAGEDFSVAATCASTWSYILAEITWIMLLLCLRTYGFKVCSPGMPRELDACAGHDKCGSVPITRTSDHGDMVMELSFGLVCRICRMGGGSWCTDSRIYACDLQRAPHWRAWPGPTWRDLLSWSEPMRNAKSFQASWILKNIAATRKNKFNRRTVTFNDHNALWSNRGVISCWILAHHVQGLSQPWCHVGFGKVNAKCNPQVSAPPLFITDSLPSATLSAHNRHTSERYSPRGDMGKSSNCCIN